MKLITIYFALLLAPLSISVWAKSPGENQHDINDVYQAINKYLEGRSYNKLALLESAFSVDATLYLTSNGELKVFTPKQYVALFEKREPNTFNGRYGKILGIDIYNDIATAKAEIRIPQRNMHFMDLFLLKKKANGWIIISKTATRM